MRRSALLIGLALLAAPLAANSHERVRPARAPVLVELFTAQGCADCAEANELIAKLADEKGVIALTLPVDYWDYLGWRDTFAKPEFGERQRAYMKAMKLRDVYTPQVIVEGQRQLSGVKFDEVQATIHKAMTARSPEPEIAFSGAARVQIGSGRAPHGGAVVWLVRYDREDREVTVKTGENKGRVIHHTHLVRELKKLGEWRGAARSYRLPKADADNLQTVVIVQGAQAGRIIGAKAA